MTSSKNQIKTRLCSQCDLEKPIIDFLKNSQKCKICVNKKTIFQTKKIKDLTKKLNKLKTKNLFNFEKAICIIYQLHEYFESTILKMGDLSRDEYYQILIKYQHIEDETKICSNQNCEFKNQHQPIYNFDKSTHTIDGYSYYCKSCGNKLSLDRKYKDFRNQLDQLDQDDYNTTIACMYVNCTSENRILNSTKLTKKELISILKLENLYKLKTCQTCGKLCDTSEFESGNSQAYICLNCRHAYGKQHFNRTVKFDNYASQIDYVDSVRKSLDTLNILEVKCKNCQKWFKPTYTQILMRISALNGIVTSPGAENHLYCSPKCKNECSIFKKQNYSKTHHSKNQNNRPGQKEWRDMVITCSESTCEICGKILDPNDLIGHHIDPIICNPLESSDIDNGISVCNECHLKTHNLPGCSIGSLIQHSKKLKDKR